MNEKRKPNIVKYIGKLFSAALLILLIIVGLFLAYYYMSSKLVAKNPEYEPKINLYTIISGSMTPTINVYDVIIDYKVNDPTSIKVGDIITFKSTSNISKDLIVTHRVIDIKVVNGKYEYVTKGDYNPSPDNDTAKFENIIGKVILRIPQLGRVQFLLAKRMWWFIIILLPASGVIVYDIIKLTKLIVLKQKTDNIKSKNNDKNKFQKIPDEKYEKDYKEYLKAIKNKY